MEKNIIKSAISTDSIPNLLSDSHRYKTDNGEISLLYPCYATMNLYEIYCCEGNLFDDIERFDTLEEAEQRIGELLNPSKGEESKSPTTNKYYMDKIEGNKLIAKFMGYFNWEDKEYGKYNSSWDWLMPVVEKIEDLEFDEFKPVAVSIECLECEIKDYRKGALHFAYFEGKTKIESVWQAVIQFIQWYNTQPQ